MKQGAFENFKRGLFDTLEHFISVFIWMFGILIFRIFLVGFDAVYEQGLSNPIALYFLTLFAIAISYAVVERLVYAVLKSMGSKNAKLQSGCWTLLGPSAFFPFFTPLFALFKKRPPKWLFNIDIFMKELQIQAPK